MTNKILMGASFLAIMAAFPAFAAEVKAKADVSTETKIESTLNKAGDSIEKTSEKAGAAVKDAYSDVKAYFTDDKDIKAMTSVNVLDHLTAKELIGAKVQNAQGKDVGKIHDIIISKGGDAESVIIEDGGVLGLGSKLAVFDFDIIEGLAKDKNVVVKLSEESVAKARGFEYESSKKGDEKIIVMPADKFSVEKILKAKIVDPKGKKIASVDTVAFDGRDADYLIVTFDKVLGMGGEKAALDIDALNLVNENGKYTFKLNAEQTAQFENYKETTKSN